MFTTVRTLVLAGLLTFPLAGFAQDQTTTTEGEAPAAEQPAADGAEAPTGLSMGISEDGEPQIGQTYIAENFSDWQLRCVKTEDGKDPCQLYQLLKDGEGNSVAEFSLFNLPAGQQAVAGATVITPLETLLTAQLRLAVDAGQGKRYPYSFCSEIGCFARLGFTAEEIESFKKGVAAKVVLVPAAAPNDTVDLTVSLKGFTAGWNAVSAANAE
jgi:invasion protein IalB